MIKEGLPHNKIKYVFNAINYERLEIFQKVSIAINDKYKIVLMFGCPFKIKGVDVAISAISEMNLEGKNIFLAIAYSGSIIELEFEIIKYFGTIPDWIKLLTAREDVASFYNASDIFYQLAGKKDFLMRSLKRHIVIH